MSLEILLSDKKSCIIKKWRDMLVGTYPADTKRFFEKEKDQFANPVGHAINKEMEILYDAVTGRGDMDKVSSSLDSIIRIRAVQDFDPSLAIGFVLQLKRVIRDELGEKIPGNGSRHEIEALYDRIDEMALLAFDIYSRCRQQIYEIRVNEVKNNVGKLLERANLTLEISE